jgi:hypothetical protein
MDWTSEKLVAKRGILWSPNVIPGKVLSHATAAVVKRFYVPTEMSIGLRTRDYVSFNSEGKKVQLQEQLILCNLKMPT